MRQLTLTAPNALEWQDVPDPRLQDPADAIVRPLAVAVCDFDRAVVMGRYTALRHPIAVGHEIVAEVVETGAECAACETARRSSSHSTFHAEPAELPSSTDQ